MKSISFKKIKFRALTVKLPSCCDIPHVHTDWDVNTEARVLSYAKPYYKLGAVRQKEKLPL